MRIDEADAMVLFTAVLVVVTIWYAWNTHRISKASARSATHSQQAAQAAQAAAQIAELDLRLRAAPIVTAHIVDTPQLGERLEVTNVGTVAATNVKASVSTKDGTAYWQCHIADVLPPDQTSRSLVEVKRDDIPLYVGEPASLNLEYQHPAGHRYRFEQPFQGSMPARLLRWDADRWVPFLPEDASLMVSTR